MNVKLRQILAATVIACMSVTPIQAQTMELRYDGEIHMYNEAPIELYVNNVKIEKLPMPPVQINGRTLVPTREICEPLGANVEYKENERKVYIDYDGSLIVIQPDNKDVWVNGEVITLDVPAKIINDKIMVPVRFVGETLGAIVEWVEGNPRIVYINKDTQRPEVEEPDVEEPEVEQPEPEVEEPEVEEPEVEQPEPEVEEPDVEEPEVEQPEPEVEEPDVEEPEVEQPEPEVEEPEVEDTSIKDLFDGVQEQYQGAKPQVNVAIKNQSNAQTRVEKVDMTMFGKDLEVNIAAQSALTDAKISKSNGKVIIDIPNTKSGLATEIAPITNDYITNIRTSQFTSDTTRVVLDLKAGAAVEARLSADRKTIQITLSEQKLEEVLYGSNRTGDYLVLENFSQDQIKMQDNRKSKSLTITLPKTQLDEPIKWTNLKGMFVQDVYVKQESEGTVITVDLYPDVEYVHKMSAKEGHLVIGFEEPDFKNIDYIGQGEKVIELKLPNNFKMSDVKVHDRYHDYELVIDLGANYKDYFGDGILAVDDEAIGQINIETKGTTQIRVSQKIIHTVDLKESNGQLKINLIRPKEKYQRIVLLDIGHGGADPGAVKNGLQEKVLNDKQAAAIIQKLESQTNIKVYTTRDDDSTLTLQYRAKLANDIDADIFVSIHNNSATSTTVTGTEVLYFPDPSDSRGKQMAQIVQDSIIDAVGTVNRGIKARDGLYVLKNTKMPAILLEGGFMSNAQEAQRLNSNEFTQAYAQAVVDGIVKIFNTLSFR